MLGWLFVLCGVPGRGAVACDLVCYVLLAGWLLVLLIVLFMFAGYKAAYAFVGWFRYVFIFLFCCCWLLTDSVVFGCCYLLDLLCWLFSSFECSLIFVLIGFYLPDCCVLCCLLVCFVGLEWFCLSIFW